MSKGRFLFELIIGVVLSAAPVIAQTATSAQIGGKTYSTGLLKRAKDAPRTFYAPSTFAATALPDSYDSRDDGVIPAIRNQGQCGSCWAFATTGAFETALIKAGKLSSDSGNLAEQDPLVNDRSAYGCQGGFMDGTFLTSQGETTEALCPYRASDRYSCRGAKFAKATRWALLGSSGRAPTVDELKAGIVQYGALFVTVAAGNGFNPRGGRITTCSSNQINHMVQLVAYRPAVEGGTEFLIKNSWGASWGDGGYAWSKQGCNRLANDPGDAAGFFYAEGAGPQPQPVVISGLAEEYVVTKGNPVNVSVTPVAGVTYAWSVGGGPVVTGSYVNVQTTTGTTAKVKVTDVDGAVTEKTVKVTVR